MDTGVPGSRPRLADRRRAEPGAKSLFGESKHAGRRVKRALPPCLACVRRNYFRTGNAATRLRQVGDYVVHRLPSLMIKKRAGTWSRRSSLSRMCEIRRAD